MGYTWGLASWLPRRSAHRSPTAPFTPQWPACLDRNRSIIEQVSEHEVLLSYPYETMDAFVQLLREAADDPQVISIKITLYRLARQSHLAEALIAPPRTARRSPPCSSCAPASTRATTSSGRSASSRPAATSSTASATSRCTARSAASRARPTTGCSTSRSWARATTTRRRRSSTPTSRSSPPTRPSAATPPTSSATWRWRTLRTTTTSCGWRRCRSSRTSCAASTSRSSAGAAGEPCGLFFKTNSITDKDVIDKLAEASQAGVPITLLVRGISLHRAGRGGLHRQRPRGVHRRPPARAQPHLRLRPARDDAAVPVQRRPHDAQHGQAHRDRLARARTRRCAARCSGTWTSA